MVFRAMFIYRGECTTALKGACADWFGLDGVVDPGGLKQMTPPVPLRSKNKHMTTAFLSSINFSMFEEVFDNSGNLC